MTKHARIIGLTATAALALGMAAGVSKVTRAAPAGGLVLDHVNVVDVRSGSIARNRSVLIVGDKIARIGAAGSVGGRGDRHIDGHGGFLVPGYNDMHAHNLNTASPETSLPLMLANGVTGFRQMAGAPPLLARRESGQPVVPVESPALLAMPGTLLAGPAFADPVAVKAEVDRQKTQGADFIKVVDLPAKAFVAAADEATAQGLPYSGHLPPTVDAREAIRHNMRSIEHLGPTISLLLSCSTDEAAARAILAMVPPGAGVDFDMEPGKLQRMLANPALLTPPPAFKLIHRVLATYDEARCRAFAKELAASQTWVVPTLSRLEAMNLGNDPALRNNPDLRFVPPALRTMWADVGQTFDSKLNAEQKATLAELFARQLQLARLFDAEGVKMITGTDFGGQWLVSGFSLHHEFDLLARAGLSPLRILQMSTIDPARYLHREAAMGTVAPGKAADLVLLGADPTKSVAAMHRITGVVRAGRFYDRTALDAIEARQADRLK